MTVSISTIRTDSYNAIYNFLHTGTYKITNYNNIHSSYSDLFMKQQGYPQIIINTPLITKVKKTLNGDIKEAMVNVTIDVHNNTLANLRTVMDEISNKFRIGGNTISNLYLIEEPTDDVDVVYQMKNKIIGIGKLSMNFRWSG